MRPKLLFSWPGRDRQSLLFQWVRRAFQRKWLGNVNLSTHVVEGDHSATWTSPHLSNQVTYVDSYINARGEERKLG